MSVIYRNSMNVIGKLVPEKLQPLWKHPAGPQTIFFWAPAFKWGLVIAGLGDLQRPVNKISISQSCALGITGLIWTRYSLVITPRNWNLFSVNLFVAFTAIYQITRALRYQRQQAALETAKAIPSDAAH
ncbi:PREDICTED: mitochondrial pyruvate carrier 3-like [Cyphomyrmex costatus]|uniref:Mitochondrial pyruvate carrier n=1 Tax=Cyphomyrmex costatus TaxID=456900 RepID=A0A195C703_9HYME|nr:PREDICTED: mitochondrial pyruvate carrier 3-like [Cyphomyrmex costatus]KYM96415.1 Brain protein 44 [Cyphomyrmex costatus]